MNTTTNASSCSSPLNPTTKKIAETTAFCLLFVVSLVGNCLVVFIVYQTKNMRKPINFFITNMAISDLLFPLIVFPRYLAEMYEDSWLISGTLGDVFCKVIPVLADIPTAVSVQSLVLITVDRFAAVAFPLHPPLFSSKRCFFFIFGTWIIGVTVHLPYLLAYGLVESPGQLKCEWRWNEAFGESFSEAHYYLTLHVVFLYIPVALMTIFYSIIIFKLKSKKMPGEQSVNTQRRRVRKNRNVVRLAVAIVLGFVLSWLPWSVIWMVDYFAWDSRMPCRIRYYWHVAWFIGRANCALNPYICFVFNVNYRRGFERILRGDSENCISNT